MRYFLVITLLMFSKFSIAGIKNYACEFNDKGRTGKANIQLDNFQGGIEIIHISGHYNYQDCQVNKDDFGLLIDCSEKNIDLMVLLNEDSKAVKGGIMSSTHNLFLDLDC